ncbi:MAG TPA: hypothetical protein VE967_05750, partial [Gemmatimonadaceae bacterium]|nr:hypothetical protein [Gemmatimonadaceae bacterium]
MCSRSSVVAAAVLNLAVGVAAQTPPKVDPKSLTHGGSEYQVVHGWPLLPESEMLGIVSAVAVDSHNHV